MCTVCCTRFARSCVRLIACQNWAVGSIMLTGLLFLGSADAQASRLKRLQQQPPPKTIVLSTTDGVVSAPSSTPAPAPAPAPAPVTIEVEQSPAQAPVTQAPVISWDGKQLTIDAENASLSEILLAIRARTGASIEMPPSTSSERVAVHMGPAPVREVISSLLYGTDFNYVIQSSDGDEEGLGKVIITAREKDSSEDGPGSNTPANRSVRLMPGYAAPGKRDFEVRHENSDASVQSEPSTPGAGEVASQAAADPGSETPPAASKADGQPAPSAAGESADTGAPAADAGAGSMGLVQPGTSAAIASSSGGGSGDGSSISKMEQDLQRLYEQRKQMQAQQNHTQPQAPGN